MTATTQRGMHWAITDNTQNGQDFLRHLQANPEKLPTWVKKIYGGLEMASTGQIHFQGHISAKNNVRFSQVKKLLPGAHIELARNFNASIVYAMKSDTAVGEKICAENPDETHILAPGQILSDVAEHIISTGVDISVLRYECMLSDSEKSLPREQRRSQYASNKDAIMGYYWKAVNQIIYNDSNLRLHPGRYARTDILTLWKNTWDTYLKVAIEESCNSITQDSSLEVPPEVNEIISHYSIESNATPRSSTQTPSPPSPTQSPSMA